MRVGDQNGVWQSLHARSAWLQAPPIDSGPWSALSGPELKISPPVAKAVTTTSSGTMAAPTSPDPVKRPSRFMRAAYFNRVAK
jgi:hypothetical protein